MTKQDYNELFHAMGKGVFANLIKTDVRSRVPEPYASMYVKQFEDFKSLVDYLEFVAKQMRR